MTHLRLEIDTCKKCMEELKFLEDVASCLISLKPHT